MSELVLFFPLCLIVSLVMSAVKEDDLRAATLRGLRLFALLTGGTAAFCAVLYFLTEVL
ncbi:MAG: hypothetical protein HYR85_10900 [Planctomycetes bacterium]|nr:hypothetical protein [Planctomycetota bacterium]MBI3847277.1 hypothetical protein [Planctomycetota bacterium]